jgi:hypothetical protein
MRSKYNVIIFLVFVVDLFRVQISLAQNDNEGLGILMENQKWQLLGSSILQELSARFPDREALCTFMNLSEKYGLLQNNYKKEASNASSSEASMIVSTIDGFASALTSAANDFGGNGEIDESLEFLRLVLIIRPDHWPAQMSMATCYYVKVDCMNSLNGVI